MNTTDIKAQGIKRRQGLDRRIEELGRLNDRRIAALDRGDREELLRIAAEYLMRGMTATAAEVALEAG